MGEQLKAEPIPTDFKGTAGEWETRGNKIFVKGTYIQVAQVAVQQNYEPVTFKPKRDIEAEANMKVLVNSKRMLEHLEKAQKTLKALGDYCPQYESELTTFIEEIKTI